MREKYKLEIAGKTELLKKNIFGKTVCLCLQGKSIEQLENKISYFKNLKVCWGGQNRYDCIQENILNKIDEELSIVMDIGTVRYQDEYDQYIRIPRIENFIKRNPSGSVITSHVVMNNLYKIKILTGINPTLNFIFVDADNCNFSVPNSLTIYLLLLTQYGANQVILFGLDGFGNPKAFSTDSIPDISLNSGYELRPDEIETYYKSETVKRDRQIAFGSPVASALFSDSPAFNSQFLSVYEKYCEDNEIKQIKIYNCNPNSLFTLFEKISYQKAIELCRQN